MPLLHLKRIIFLYLPTLFAGKKITSASTAYFQFIIYQKAQIIYLGKAYFFPTVRGIAAKAFVIPGLPFSLLALCSWSMIYDVFLGPAQMKQCEGPLLSLMPISRARAPQPRKIAHKPPFARA
ncbi:hypothetical protein NPIL_53561 [Nephila pilipes]|uniref:Uncharacterized protein n=1 Tax=Nephila pilipes TaxID=299642 RepID=A0A8X6TXE5_NEPPI|nr:hypothetical protein NPIL_53561 [Nephila pilipes]